MCDCPRDLRGACCAFWGFFIGGVALMALMVTSLPDAAMPRLQQEVDDLEAAHDALCTLSPLPGTARSQRQDYRYWKRQSVPVQLVECLATASYTRNGTHAGGSVGVRVLAGYDFTLERDPRQWCADVLAGAWPYVEFPAAGSGAGQASPAGAGAARGWSCGDSGWVGCKIVSAGVLSTKTVCSYHRGPAPGFSDNLGGYNYVLAGLDGPSCLAARAGAELRCSVDAEGQVRLGSTGELLRAAEDNVRTARNAARGLRKWSWRIAAVSACFFAASCYTFNCAGACSAGKIWESLGLPRRERVRARERLLGGP